MIRRPLLPNACQSVRMKFLAILPGLHSIDVLTLTDVQSGFVVNMRYIQASILFVRLFASNASTV